MTPLLRGDEDLLREERAFRAAVERYETAMHARQGAAFVVGLLTGWFLVVLFWGIQ